MNIFEKLISNEIVLEEKLFSFIFFMMPLSKEKVIKVDEKSYKRKIVFSQKSIKTQVPHSQCSLRENPKFFFTKFQT
jgi:hypothetical protein